VFELLRTELRARGSNVHLTTVHLPGVNTPQFERAHSRSVQLAATKHRRAVVLGAAGALVAGGVALARSL
jgi:hypothetical protein